MHDTHGKSMSPFEIFLRTGRKVSDLATISLKFNPWHDPDDGRFTFRDQGTAYGGGRGGGGRGGGGAASGSAPTPKRKRTPFGGFGGGGDSFNGGGASGPLPAPTRTPTDKPQNSPPLAAKPKQSQSAGLPAAQIRNPLPKPRATANPIRHVVERNGYRFGLDEQRRTLVVTGQLNSPKTIERSRTEQRRAGASDRRSDDDGGHFIAARFGGPKDAYNHFAQNANFNRGGYRVIEDRWAREMRAGKRVVVDISVTYSKYSKRPSGLVVSWTVEGLHLKQRFSNEKGHGK